MAGRRGPQSIDQFEFVIVVLVVARHIDDRCTRELARRPLNARCPNADVTSQHDDLCVGSRRSEVGKLRVEVTAPINLVSANLDATRGTRLAASGSERCCLRGDS